MIDGRHVTTFDAGEPIEMDAPSLQGSKHTFVVTDIGLKLMYGLDVAPPPPDESNLNK